MLELRLWLEVVEVTVGLIAVGLVADGLVADAGPADGVVVDGTLLVSKACAGLKGTG